jgi:hypothetical protein
MKSRKLRSEQLERRQLMAADIGIEVPSVVLTDGELAIVGTPADDLIAVKSRGSLVATLTRHCRTSTHLAEPGAA